MKFNNNDFDDDLSNPMISTYSGYTVIYRPITVLKAATFPRNYSNQHSI